MQTLNVRNKINLNTQNGDKLLVSGFRDSAERVTEELLEPAD